MKKSFILLSTVFLFTACQSSTSAADSPFPTPSAVTAIKLKDVSDHWAMSAIEGAVKKGYVDGYEDSTFKPENNVSRAEFVKMVITAIKEPVKSVSSGADWSSPYIAAAINKGILRESDFLIDNVNDPISRLEMSRISLRATDVTLQNKAIQIDNDSVMYNAAKMGLIQGMAKGALEPKSSTTRAQSVTIIERILKVNQGGTLEIDNYAVGNAELELKHTNIFTVMPHIFGGEQIEKWNPENLTLETGDGLYKGTMDQIVAIDLEDPNDPNLALLGDISKLKWFNGRSFENSPYVESRYMNSYVIYFKGHVDFNNDTNIYKSSSTLPIFSLDGFKNGAPTDSINGILSSPRPLFFKTSTDVPALIIPKDSITDSYAGFSISAPAIPPAQNYNKKIFYSLIPEKIIKQHY
ncbi:S-layer homology domain-containing protein [Paenibacillus sp. LMG 31461]|uniref:S-layer homology domain-containing protein n=1 Tax=Paenibacillus plantarum TaxID=2654975 RepID=A0ABX1XHL6_9BACL|nr:S-layer homology domain-containing protein [Paenibacillus plantarum]NOU67340.1 S-layer homology domain-containing protein [Paenibacillus plantarum]